MSDDPCREVHAPVASGEDLAFLACDVDTRKELFVNAVLPGGSAGGPRHFLPQHHDCALSSAKDVYAQYAFHIDDQVNES